MEIIVFSGGLGNQMFQYAFYLAKKKLSPDVCINIYSVLREERHNGFELERLFGIAPENSSLTVRMVRKLLIFEKKKYTQKLSSLVLSLIQLTGIKIIQEKGYSFYNPDYLKPEKGALLYFGFWQTPLYFDLLTNEIKEKFSFTNLKLSDKSESLLKMIQTLETVSIHIRRGDFLASEVQNEICDQTYYIQAISWINNRIENLHFVFFSDEPEWVKKNIPLQNAVCVDWNQGIDSWQDMYLMSKCKHNIIANSTFSWWGAWLNDNEKKVVIAPSRFLNKGETPDVYPKNWILF